MPDFLAEVLTWPSSYPYLIAVQTAYDMQMPPSMFINLDTPGTEWTVPDRKLIMAWNVLKRETCNQCGQPLWICRSSSNNLSFKIQTAICYATQAKSKWDESKRGKALKPGEYGYIVPYRIDETKPLPTRHEWLTELAEEAE